MSKIKSIKQLQKIPGGSAVYSFLYRNNRELLYRMLSPTIRKFSDIEIINIARKYKTVTEWVKNDPSSYNSARRRNIHTLCCKHMIVRNVSGSNKKECLLQAKKYDTKTAWKHCKNSKYNRARECGWLLECCKHMTTPKRNPKTKKVVNLNTGKIYSSCKKASIDIGVARESINGAVNGRYKTSGGYRWSYCDDNGNILK